MKYREQFFISEQQNKKTCIMVNEKVFSQYMVHDENSEAWKELKEILLNSCYDVNYSQIVISENKREMCWHLNNIDKDKYPRQRGFDPNGVTLDMINDSDIKFEPGYLEFDAPAIGEEFYVWTDIAIRHCTVHSITVECDPKRYHESITVVFRYEENGKEDFCSVHANKFKDLKKEIDEICRKSENDFDAAFWYKQIDRIRSEYEEDYDRLQNDFNSYRDWY